MRTRSTLPRLGEVLRSIRPWQITRCRSEEDQDRRHDREMGQQRIDLAKRAVALTLRDDVAHAPRTRRSSTGRCWRRSAARRRRARAA